MSAGNRHAVGAEDGEDAAVLRPSRSRTESQTKFSHVSVIRQRKRFSEVANSTRRRVSKRRSDRLKNVVGEGKRDFRLSSGMNMRMKMQADLAS
jgi:hypothetical protein